jgi:putative aminopeptidase FrvX
MDKGTDHPILSLFADLLSVPSPSGREERLAQVIRSKLDAWGYDHHTDSIGNVIVRLEGRQPEAPLCCLAAHIDEIGMVVTNIEPDGSLRVDASGGLLPWKIGECPIEILGDDRTITGVLSMGSVHTSGPSERTLTWKDTHVLTGLSPEKLKNIGIRPGSVAVPVRAVCGPIPFGEPDDPLVAAWTFDDRMGAAALLRFLETWKQQARQPYHPTLVAFTVQEEIGGYGAMTLAQREKPEFFIAIDGCPMPPGTPLQLDSRPGIWCKDARSYYDSRLIRDLCQAARQAGTELQPVVYEAAASDASLVYVVGGAPRVACFGHVRENSHGYEVIRLACCENIVKTLVRFMTDWEGA